MITDAQAALAASDYLNRRVHSHAKLADLTQVKTSEQMGLFAWFSMLIAENLKLGHTFLALDGSNQTFAQLSFDGGRWAIDFLPIWQINAIATGLLWLDDVLGRTWVEFGDVVQVLHHQPKDKLACFVADSCQSFAEQVQLTGKSAQIAHDAAAFLHRLLQFCYICHHRRLDSPKAVLAALAAMPLCVDYQQATAHAKPLVYCFCEAGGGLWLYRSWHAEYQLARHITRLLSLQHAYATHVLSDKLNHEQKQAVESALRYNFCMITGGPGTGKTFTVAQLVNELCKHKTVNLALVAPTGKAAQRMQESLQQAMAGSTIDASLFDAKTIHRLLGMGVGQPRFDEKNPLPYDVVIVDEASMLGVELAYRLCAAIATGAKLILLGDVDQLAAVEAGAVLADLCRITKLKPYHQKLIQSRRFDEHSGVGRLAAAVNQSVLDDFAYTADGDAQTAIHAKLAQVMSVIECYDELSWQDSSQIASDELYMMLASAYQDYFAACAQLDTADDKSFVMADLFDKLNAYRILTASHQGDLGDEAINMALSEVHYHFNVIHHSGTQGYRKHNDHRYSRRQHNTPVPLWYHGRVVMITKNNYELGLFNGDMGICLAQPQGFFVYFDGKPTAIAISLLPEQSVTTAYAITIHKSQGSEFHQVAVCFDESNRRLLGQELVYTAITRAKKSVHIYTTKAALAAAIAYPTVRQTGLPLVFEQLNE